MNPHHLFVTGRPGDPAGALRVGDYICPARLGHQGLLAEGTPPAEGDRATPTGTLALRQVYYRSDRLAKPVTGLPVIALTPESLWCDDPDHALYNRPVTAPFSARTEQLWRPTRSYDICVVLDFNLTKPQPGLGSAIFFHLTRQDEDPPPTEGCVAISPENMLNILPLLGIGSTMTIGQA